MAYIVRQGNLDTDKTALLKFWSEHGTKPLDKKFTWIYRGNPYGKTIFWLLIDDVNGCIVGSSALFARDISVKGKIYRAGIAGDLLIHKSHRTLGPALMLMREVFSQASSSGFDIVYTLPNKSADLLAKRVGYKKIGALTRYVNLFRVKQQLIKRGVPQAIASILSPLLEILLALVKLTLFRKSVSELKFQRLYEFDDRFLILWGEYAADGLVVPSRSKEYMSWKYFDDPDVTNKVYAAFTADGKEMLGCMVYCEKDSSTEIRELILRPNTIFHNEIAHNFFRYLHKREVESIFMNIIDNSFLSKMLSSLGFTSRGVGRNIRCACFTDEISEDILSHSGNWLFVMSDEDT